MTVVALAEALSAARASGAVDGKVLFETLARSSADSFVLRNHGMKCMLTGEHPTEGTFPTDYILKDLSYALDFAEGAGMEMRAAHVTRDLMEQTRDAGFARNYYTAVIETLGRAIGGAGTRSQLPEMPAQQRKGCGREAYRGRPRTKRNPCSTRRSIVSEIRPARSERNCSSRVTIWDTFATESRGRPVTRRASSTLPGAFASRRFDVIATAMTV